MDVNRLLEILGVESVEEVSFDEVIKHAEDALVKSMKPWQGDTPTDEAARAVMSATVPMMEAMRKAREVNPLVFRLLIEQFNLTVHHIRALDALADLRQ